MLAFTPTLPPPPKTASVNLPPQFSEITDANLDDYLRYLAAKLGRDPYAMFYYVDVNYRYRAGPILSQREMAIRMANSGKGACYDFAAFFTLFYRAAGIGVHHITGEAFGRAHYWNIIEVSPGVWRHIDATPKAMSAYGLTDDQLISEGKRNGVNYVWDRTIWSSNLNRGSIIEPETTAPTDEETTEGATAETESASAAESTNPPESVTETSGETTPAESSGETSSTESEPETESSEAPTAPTETAAAETQPTSEEPAETEPGTPPESSAAESETGAETAPSEP